MSFVTVLNTSTGQGDLLVLGDHSGWRKPPVDKDLLCSVILPGQYVATEAVHKLPGLSELSQQEAFSIQNGHPVQVLYKFIASFLECVS